VKYFVDAGEGTRLDATARINLRGRYIRLSDGITHYELTGPEDGEVVVLAGGLTVPLFYWDDMAAALHTHGLRTLTYSAYGRGYSDRVTGRYNEALFVRQLNELIKDLAPAAPRHLVGASMGALVAMAHLSQHASTTATLTLIGPAGLSQQPTAQKLLLSNDIAVGLIARHLGRRIFDRHQSHNVRDPQRAADLAAMIGDAYRYEGSLFAFFDTLQHFPLFDRSDLYRDTGTLGVPTMLMWGNEDQVTPISTSVADVVMCWDADLYERPRMPPVSLRRGWDVRRGPCDRSLRSHCTARAVGGRGPGPGC
jgi:pimeloyl-ACP methyl ester carboxylesterase